MCTFMLLHSVSIGYTYIWIHVVHQLQKICIQYTVNVSLLVFSSSHLWSSRKSILFLFLISLHDTHSFQTYYILPTCSVSFFLYFSPLSLTYHRYLLNVCGWINMCLFISFFIPYFLVTILNFLSATLCAAFEIMSSVISLNS